MPIMDLAALRAKITDNIEEQTLANPMLIIAVEADPISGWGSERDGPYSAGAAFMAPKKTFTHRFALVDAENNGLAVTLKRSEREDHEGPGDRVLVSECNLEGPIGGEFAVS